MDSKFVKAASILGLSLSAAALADVPSPDNQYKVGVFYYPGWSKNIPVNYQDGAWCPRPDLTQSDAWCTIKKPEFSLMREPATLPGYSYGSWYEDRATETLKGQIALMAEKGINFVVFDWFVKGGSETSTVIRPHLNQALEAFKLAEKPANFRYMLMWESKVSFPKTKQDFDDILELLIRDMADPSNKGDATHRGVLSSIYLLKGDQPIVDISEFLDSYHKWDFRILFNTIRTSNPELNWGETDYKKLLEYAEQKIASRLYLPNSTTAVTGVHFVGNITPTADGFYWANQFGFDAVSQYNYHTTFNTPEAANPGETEASKTYAELAGYYKQNWDYLIGKAKANTASSTPNSVKYVYPPATTGWDMRPWQTAEQQAASVEHNKSWGSVYEFEDHLIELRKSLHGARKTLGGSSFDNSELSTVICCWNEYGEGSILEPIVGRPLHFVDAVKRVFVDEKPTDFTKPAAISDLRVTDTTTTSITLEWTPPYENYRIQRYEVALSGVKVATTTVPGVTLMGLYSDATYSGLTVRAIDFAGNIADASNSVTVNTKNPNLLQNDLTIYYQRRPGYQDICLNYSYQQGSITKTSSVPGTRLMNSEIPGYSKVTLQIGSATQISAAFNNCAAAPNTRSEGTFTYSTANDYTYVGGTTPVIVTTTPSAAASTSVEFAVNATVANGERLYLVGDVYELGVWDTNRAIPMTRDGDIWKVKVDKLPQNKQLNYEYIKINQNGQQTAIENNINARYFYTPSSGNAVRPVDMWNQ